jgi:hypothetical protein
MLRYFIILLALLILKLTPLKAQENWGLSLQTGPSVSHLHSTTGVPHAKFYLTNNIGYTKGIHLHRNFDSGFSLYTGLKWTSIKLGF